MSGPLIFGLAASRLTAAGMTDLYFRIPLISTAVTIILAATTLMGGLPVYAWLPVRIPMIPVACSNLIPAIIPI